MVGLLSKTAIACTIVFAVTYQFLFKIFLFDFAGFGRQVQSINDFPNFHCEKIQHPSLEACEDIRLHEPTGYLYMACSDSRSRTKWLPAVSHLNAYERGMNDRIAMLDTRSTQPLEKRLKWLSVEDFSGINGDKTFNLHGIDILMNKNSNTIRILLVNHRPPLHPVTGKVLDARLWGANSTIEQFQTEAGSSSMRHVRTYSHELINTPNAVAWVTDHSFVFSNHHSHKTGLRRKIDPFDSFLGKGSIGYCDRSRCNIAYSGLQLPNGIIRHQDGLIYVASTFTNNINVFTITEDHTLTKIDTIPIGLPLDNLSIDRNGNIYAAGFPQAYILAKSVSRPFEVNPPSAIFKISRAEKSNEATGRQAKLEVYRGSYVVEKVVEDNGTVLPGSTSAIYDPQTRRYFLAGLMSPFITMCVTE